jgi:hypothetical protein
MRDIMDEAIPPYSSEHGEHIFISPQEAEKSVDFRFIPFDPSNFPEGKLAVIRGQVVTHIKESMQDYTRLDSDVRQFREISTRGDYIWSIFGDLGMTKSELPTPEFRAAYSNAHAIAEDPKAVDIGELLDKYEDHPALSFIDTLKAITPPSDVYQKEVVMMKRSMLIMLDEYS